MVLYFQNLEKKIQFTKIIQHWPQNDSTPKTLLGINFLLVKHTLLTFTKVYYNSILSAQCCMVLYFQKLEKISIHVNHTTLATK